MKWKLIFLLFTILAILPLINAEPSFFVPKNSNYTIKVSVDIDGARLSSNGLCNITINYPNSTIMVNDKVMNNLGNGYFSYNISSGQTDLMGEYFSRMECWDNNLNDTSVFNYEVNLAGIRPTDQRTETMTRTIYFIFGIAIILFVAFFISLFVKKAPPVTWTFFIMSFIFFLMGLNFLFITLQDEIVNPKLINFFDSFTAISFIMYWFLAGLLIIMWIFTFINTWLLNKNLKNIQRFGEE